MRARTLLPLAAVLPLALLAATPQPGYTATPLAPRSPAPVGGKPFTVLTAAETGVDVPNVYNDPRMWGERFREFTLGALETGVAIADFNRDGRPDIFAVSKNGPCALYIQVAPLKFENRAAAGVAAEDGTPKIGATAVDINQDGWPDLYLCRYDAPNLLFVNNGDGTFTERAKDYGLDLKDASVHAVFADYDRDGDLDAYLVTNILDFSKSPQGRRDYLLRNDGGTFADVSKTAGIWGLTQGHTALWFDANDDGWPDLYVANDFETPDRFYLNKGDGSFVDVVDQRLPHVTYFSMGADAGDINNDGRLDFLVTDMRERTHAGFMVGIEEVGRGLWETERVTELIPQYMWNALYLNTGTDRYLELAHFAGMEATGWTWAPRFADLDNDGRLDVFFTSGMLRNFLDADLVDHQNRAPTLAARAAVWKNSPPRLESTLAYRNLGDLRFADVSTSWGLDQSAIAFGCATVDLDGDGDLDLVYANCDAPPTLVRNDTVTGHVLLVKLAGAAPNRDGIGAELRIETAAGVQVRQLFPERGIVASEPPGAHFGLGDAKTVRRLTVRWPRGQVQTVENVPADQFVTLAEPPIEPAATLSPAQLATPANPAARFTETAAARGLKLETKLQPFDELVRQRLLPRRLNGAVPAVATADADGDGRDDVFVSGQSGRAGRLFLAQADGTFAPAPDQPWAAEAERDEPAALFTDLDGDNHPELIVASGGVRRAEGDPLLGVRVFHNDGHGRFTAAPADAIPFAGTSVGALATADFDGDHATDLFVGGRVVPGKFPAAPRSFLLRNVAGKLVDVTDELAPGLRQLGMVTAAAWADVDGDKRPDLVLALDWGPISYWHNTGHGFENRTEQAGLATRTGWWSALTIADVNSDGRPDLVVGNAGLNTKYHATAAEPALLYAGVFDASGREQLVEARYVDGRPVPVRGRSKLAYAFPWIPKKFPTYAAFAQASVEEIFGADRLAQTRRLAATELASGVYLNNGHGDFTFIELPSAAQLAPINAIVARDFDGDGRLDLVCVGNDFGPEPTTGRFDGGLGVFLQGDGKGRFTALLPGDSGLVIPGEARGAAALTLPGAKAPAVVVVRCNGPVQLFAPSGR